MGTPETQAAGQAAENATKPKPPKPSVGRVVLYRLPFKDGKTEDRAADVVLVWNRPDDEMPLVQLLVKLDGTNDTNRLDGVDPNALLLWRTSVHYDEMGADGTWRWMPYQLGQAAKAESLMIELKEKIDQIVKCNAALAEGLDAVIDEIQTHINKQAQIKKVTPHQDV